MSDDRWRSFLREWNIGFLAYKRLMEITIYGSYYPQSQKALLFRLKDSLITEGYALARIVDERNNPERLDEWELSKACLEYSDVNFLVFTHDGMRHGVVRELCHCSASTEMIDRRWRCVVFEEMRDERSALPVLDRRELENLYLSKIRRIEFQDEESLKRSANGMAFRYLKDLATDLRSRVPG